MSHATTIRAPDAVLERPASEIRPVHTMAIGPGDYTGARPTWRVTCGDHAVVARSFPAAELARAMIAGGAADGPWRLVDAASGRVRMNGRSLHAVAGLTVSDADGGRVRFTVYRPRPVNGVAGVA